MVYRPGSKSKEFLLNLDKKKIIKVIAVGTLVIVVTVVGLFVLKDVSVIATLKGMIAKNIVVEGASFNLIDIPKEVLVEGIKYIK